MHMIFMVGTAGSGKSSLTAAFTRWLEMQREDVMAINLDPGAPSLSYSANVDIRDYIKVEDVMEEYGLGPNGGLVAATDMIRDVVEDVSQDIEDFTPDLCIVDTPGQMELFAFRASGPYIVDELTKEPKALIYLFDAVFSINPLNYVSNMFLAAAVYNRFFQPQVHLLSKTDLIPKNEVQAIANWSANTNALEDAIEQKLEGSKRLFSRNMMQAITKLGLQFHLMPISSKTNEGMVNVNTLLERILNEGEKYTT